MRISLSSLDPASSLAARISAALAKDVMHRTGVVGSRPAPEAWRSEDDLHKAVVKMIAVEAKPGVVALHFANGGKRNRAEAAKLKGLGVTAGAPDLLIICDGRALGMELKCERGILSKAQKIMRDRFIRAGAEFEVARSVAGARQILQRWGAIEPPTPPANVAAITREAA
jgi:hypothetical protein